MHERAVLLTLGEQSRRFEEVEERIALAEDRARDEPPAYEAEHVSVTRIAARHPDAVLARNGSDDREKVEDEPEDPSPAVIDPQLPPQQARDERLERRLDGRRRDFVCGELLLERHVPESARDNASVRSLVPVVEAVAAVVRDLEQQL